MLLNNIPTLFKGQGNEDILGSWSNKINLIFQKIKVIL